MPMQHFLPRNIPIPLGTVKDGLGYDIAVSTDGYGEDSQATRKQRLLSSIFMVRMSKRWRRS